MLPAVETMVPVMYSMTISASSDNSKPAIASPLGLRKIPISENMRPKSQTIHPITGTHPRRRARTDRTNPVIPSPFDLDGCGWL